MILISQKFSTTRLIWILWFWGQKDLSHNEGTRNIKPSLTPILENQVFHFSPFPDSISSALTNCYQNHRSRVSWATFLTLVCSRLLLLLHSAAPELTIVSLSIPELCQSHVGFYFSKPLLFLLIQGAFFPHSILTYPVTKAKKKRDPKLFLSDATTLNPSAIPLNFFKL